MHCQVNKLPVFECEPTQATQAEVTDEQILEVAEHFGAFEYGDAQGHKRIDFARAILALRPVQVPMDKQDAWDNSPVNSDWEAVDAYLQGIEDAEAHHGITAQAKKEGRDGLR